MLKDDRLTTIILFLYAVYIGWLLRSIIADIDAAIARDEIDWLHRANMKLLMLLKAERN